MTEPFQPSGSRSGEEPFVHMRMTIDQARAVERALDAFMRLSIGQIEEVVNLVRMGYITPQREDRLGMKELQIFDDLLIQAKAALGHAPGASLGIGNKNVSPLGARCYEVGKVLAKALAVHQDPSPQFRGVNYDGLTFRYTQDPEPMAWVHKE